MSDAVRAARDAMHQREREQGMDPEDLAASTDDDWGESVSGLLPAWKFEDYGNLIGTLIDRHMQEAPGLDGKTREVGLNTFVVENNPDPETSPNDQYVVWDSAVLERVLPLHVGHRMKIVDLGTEPGERGRTLHRYDVFCATDKEIRDRVRS